MNNPNLYEINTRLWLKRFNTDDKKAKLDDVPVSYWENLKSKGIDIVWLMGIWTTCPETIDKYCFEEGLVREYKAALKDYSKEDVIGSPFAIDSYQVNPEIGTEESIVKLKSILNERGMKLMLDFVHNHFSAESSLVFSNPEIFLEANEEYYKNDSHTFFKHGKLTDKIFAHGRDPFFPAWEDTIQVNYFSSAAREYMIKVLVKLTKICDGVRCDMAMLAFNNVFKNTWGNVLSSMGYEKPQKEFWDVALEIVKDYRNDFIFLAEAYWDLEWELQQIGFDYTYDKILTDRLKSGYVHDIRDHLLAEHDYQIKSARFIENHDEERAMKYMGKNKAKASAVIMSTLPGMHFFYDGQFEGSRITVPVQLGREPVETPVKCMPSFYDDLLKAINNQIFKIGDWHLLEVMEAWNENKTFQNILAWQWRHAGERRLVIVNYSEIKSQCRIKLDVKGFPEEMHIKDVLNNQGYLRSASDVHANGLFVELGAFHSHIFEY